MFLNAFFPKNSEKNEVIENNFFIVFAVYLKSIKLRHTENNFLQFLNIDTIFLKLHGSQQVSHYDFSDHFFDFLFFFKSLN